VANLKRGEKKTVCEGERPKKELRRNRGLASEYSANIPKRKNDKRMPT
jgi:hypothetical protein